jgi:hypothetical protein
LSRVRLHLASGLVNSSSLIALCRIDASARLADISVTVLDDELATGSGWSRVGGILRSPGFGVKRTVLTLRVLVVVQVDDISVEEDALLGRASIRRRVVNSGLSLSIASCSTEASIKRSSEDLAGDESAVALSIKRCVNGTSTVVDGIRVTSRSSNSVVSVAVWSSNQHLELVAVLSVMISGDMDSAGRG